MKRKYLAGAACAAVLVTVGLMQNRSTVAAAGVQAPRFEVDPLWPKPLPNHWVIGATIGVAVDGKDNVWIIHREGSLEAKEKYATWKPTCIRVLRSRAGRSSVQPGGRPHRLVGWSRTRIRLAVLESRH